jgi:hypothetical protein
MKKWRVQGHVLLTRDFDVEVEAQDQPFAEDAARHLQQTCWGSEAKIYVDETMSLQEAEDQDLIVECEKLATEVLNDPATQSATDTSDLCKRVLELTYVLRHRKIGGFDAGR